MGESAPRREAALVFGTAVTGIRVGPRTENVGPLLVVRVQDV